MKYILFTLLIFSTACSTLYYDFWETLGQEKRDLLSSNMEEANQSQEEIKDQFRDTLERIREEYSFEEGELEDTYDDLLADYDNAKEEAQNLDKRINKAQNIAEDLFEEWKAEAAKLDNAQYKNKSFAQLKRTKKSFYVALKDIKAVQPKLDRVLKKFHDRVIFIKHNLNAKVVGKLKVEFKNIESEMQGLISELETSTKKANAFIEELN